MLVSGKYSRWTWLFVLGLSAGFGWIAHGLSAAGIGVNAAGLALMTITACWALRRSLIQESPALNWYAMSLGIGFVTTQWYEGQWATVATLILLMLLALAATIGRAHLLKYVTLIPIIGYSMRRFGRLAELYVQHDEYLSGDAFQQLKLRPNEWKEILKLLLGALPLIILLHSVQMLLSPDVLFISRHEPTYMLSMLGWAVSSSLLMTLPAVVVEVALVVRPLLTRLATSLDSEERDRFLGAPLERGHESLSTHLRASISMVFGFTVIAAMFMPWIDRWSFGAYLGVVPGASITEGYLTGIQLMASSLSTFNPMVQIPLIVVPVTGLTGIVHGVTHFVDHFLQRGQARSGAGSGVGRVSLANNWLRWTLQLTIVDNVIALAGGTLVLLVVLFSTTSGFPMVLGDGLIVGLAGLFVLRVWGMNEKMERPWRRRWITIVVTGIGLSALVAILGTTVAYVGTHIDDVPSEQRSIEGITAHLISSISGTPLREVTDGSMVLIPSGAYISGNTGNPMYTGSSGTIDAHWVVLPAVEIDKYEVTNREYALFLEALADDPGINIPGKDHTPLYWNDPGHQPFWWYAVDGTTDDHPVIGVDYYDATAYAEWLGKRLPTSAEWEKASRGINGKAWPWGNYLDDLADDPYTNICGTEGPNDLGYTAPVGSFWKDRSIFSVYDTAGNVAEWVADGYFPEAGGIRGLAWSDKFEKIQEPDGPYLQAATYTRYWNKDYRGNWVGFRCARDVETNRRLEQETPLITRWLNWLMNRLGLGVPLIERLSIETDDSAPTRQGTGSDERARQFKVPEGWIPLEDHGRSFETATELTLGRSVEGEFRHAGDADYFKWNTLELVEYQVSVISHDGSELAATVFAVDGPAGEATQVGRKTDSQEITLVLQPQKPLEYRLKLEQVDGEYIDSYSIVVEALKPLGSEQGNLGWTLGPSMIQARYRHAGVILDDGRVLVVGGRGISGQTLDTVEVFDPSSGLWASVSPMLEPRYDHSAIVLVGGKILVFGGIGAADEHLRSAEVFDPSNGSWSSAGRLLEPRSDSAAVLLQDGRVLVAGNHYLQDDVILNSVEIYDPATDRWAYAASMEEARHGHTAVLLEDGRVLVAGGETSWMPGPCWRDWYPTASSKVEVYDPGGDKWLRVENMPEERREHEAVLLEDGRVLVVGGLDSPQQASNSASLYDQVKDDWSPAGVLVDPRVGHMLLRLPDGTVLVAGGVSRSQEGGPHDSAAVFDPRTNTWASAGYMLTSRVSYSATVLQDGRLLVAGGWIRESGQALASVEMYDPNK